MRADNCFRGGSASSMTDIASATWRALDRHLADRPLPRGLDAVQDAGLDLVSRFRPRRRAFMRRAKRILMLEQTWADMAGTKLRESVLAMRDLFRRGRGCQGIGGPARHRDGAERVCPGRQATLWTLCPSGRSRQRSGDCLVGRRVRGALRPPPGGGAEETAWSRERPCILETCHNGIPGRSKASGENGTESP
jgi:hypothetical protein